MKSLSWINFVLGLWLIIAPFVLRFSTDKMAMWDSVILGIVIAILAIARATETSTTGSFQEHGAH
jgi:SPW repeat-containing protein